MYAASRKRLTRNPNYFLDPTASSIDYATPVPSWLNVDPESANREIALNRSELAMHSDPHSPTTTKRKPKDRWAFYRKYPQQFKGIENVPPQTLQEAVELQRRRREAVSATVVPGLRKDLSSS